MQAELDEALCQRHPILFRDRHASPELTAMCWGFECDDGWFVLLDTLCAALSQHLDAAGLRDAVVTQVKQKFGRFCFRLRGGDARTAAMIRLAEHLASFVCETCGAPALPASEGWPLARCAGHGGRHFPLACTQHEQLLSELDAAESWPGRERLAPVARLPLIGPPGWQHVALALERALRDVLEDDATLELGQIRLVASRGLAFDWVGHDPLGQLSGLFELARRYAERCDPLTGCPVLAVAQSPSAGADQ